jgi:hypothetical protein
MRPSSGVSLHLSSRGFETYRNPTSALWLPGLTSEIVTAFCITSLSYPLGEQTSLSQPPTREVSINNHIFAIMHARVLASKRLPGRVFSQYSSPIPAVIVTIRLSPYIGYIRTLRCGA